MPFLNRFRLHRPRVGEFQNLRECLGFYDRVGATVPDTLNTPKITMSEAGAPRVPRKEDVFLWRILWDAMKDAGLPEWKPQYQRGGSCCGQGWKLACDTCLAVNWLISDVKFPGRAAVAPLYGGSRVEVAGKPGSWWGSNSVWVAEWARNWGVVLLKDLGFADDEMTQDERLAAEYAASRSGVPEEIERIAKQFPVLLTPKISTIDELCVSLEAGAPVAHGSNLIPTGNVDRNGISTVKRSGGHLTLLWGVRYTSGEPVFLYQNSWGNWSKQVAPEDQPKGSCWISAGDAKRILDQGDAFAACGIGGFSPLRF